MKASAGADTASVDTELVVSLKTTAPTTSIHRGLAALAANAVRAWPRLPRPLESLSWTSDICERA